MSSTKEQEAVLTLFSDPDTLTRLEVHDFQLMFSALKRNQLLIGVKLTNLDELEDDMDPFSLLGKSRHDTRQIMAMIPFVYSTQHNLLIDVFEKGTFEYYESLINQELTLSQEHCMRHKQQRPQHPAWLNWLYKDRISHHQTVLTELQRYELKTRQALMQLALMYNTLTHPAFSARLAYDNLIMQRPRGFYGTSAR